MCVQIVDPCGSLIDHQNDLVTFLETVGRPGVLVMRDGMTPNRDECLCWVNIDASLLGSGYVAVSAWDSHGTDLRLDYVAPLSSPSPEPDTNG